MVTRRRWFGMATIAIMIATPRGRRLLAASSEREAALTAELVLRTLDRLTLPTAIWVQCADLDVTFRLMGYLTGVQDEMIGA
ncbi:hypothetical protein [Methylobacterium oxalidis]|uniref:Uncharacterized protein n=1 Tax=Methylobacterium oxalidis TaxID=944322 RepID=A0A512J4A7_9HYPH|nr:hypothetical protein [Methylobacterium oxalidis]GEP04795.1 hypothetical protein MOX02_28330 [Methylobacterium oxalidis]GJE30493.1 hypothetical protein LDDCCGHA_0661 [Methylobacterium oxalidis]GLS63621.1 hypothetical protein GCM10007888_20020 [Methylobacterium oxalidis]